MNLIGIVISYVYIALVIAGAKLFEKLGKEASRKFIHIMLGNWWIIAMIFFNNVWAACFAPFTFVIINYVSCKKDLIKVMERDEEKKDGFGTVYYAMTLLILSIVSFGMLKNPSLGLIPTLIMAYGDGFAAIIGKKIKSKEYYVGKNKKTFAGSLTMYIISLIAYLAYFNFIGINMWILFGILFAVISTIIEAVSIKGLDNITVPISSLMMILLVI